MHQVERFNSFQLLVLMP